MRVSGVTVAEPVFFRDGHVEQRRAQVDERHVEAAAVEGDDGIVFFRDVPELREQFRLVRAGNEFHPVFARLRRGKRVFNLTVFKIIRDINRLAALRLSVEHGDADDLRRERPQAHELGDLLALGVLGGGVGELVGLAEKIFLLRSVEIFERQRGGLDVENEGGHKLSEN